MNVVVGGDGKVAPRAVERLARRMVHPLCGFNSRVGFLLRGRPEPRLAIAGGELSGVHRLLGQEQPGSYHIGGVGLTRHEALVRTLGESAERYCQLVAIVSGTVPVRVATLHELRQGGHVLVDPRAIGFFSAEQYARRGFLFAPAEDGAPYGWVEMRRVPDGERVYVPAQLAVVGYAPRRQRGEPWLAPAMTTGTATHTTVPAARRGALLELIQVDTAMGHWFGAAVAPRIVFGPRLAAVRRLVETWMGRSATPSFHQLPSPDLPAHTVACLVRQLGGRRPVVAVGLGSETRLVEACYKALLEAVGVFQLAKIGMATAALDGTRAGARSASEVVVELERRLAEAGVRLFELDLTTPDVAELGLVTTRLWSPDLLALALPSAPPSEHSRFAAHGGVVNDRPHPYP
jgi:ribosomal protein S12 methylthiotransferase accessory factor YcaO